MKKKIFKTLFALLPAIAAVQGCSDGGNRSQIFSAGSTDTLQLNEIPLSIELLMPTRMLVTDGCVVVYQRKGDTLFTVIPHPQSGKCFQAGLKGRGPNEFVGIDVQSLSASENGFRCMEFGGTLKNIIVGEEGIEVRKERRFDIGANPQNGILLSDRYVSANVMNGQSEFVICKPDEILYAGKYPEWTYAENEQLPFVFMKNMVPHPAEDLFAAFYVYFRRMRIFDKDGTTVHDVEVMLPDKFPAYSSGNPENHIAYGSYPSASKERIYALCCNSGISERATALPEIHVFGWDGELQRRIMLDRHIDIFAIDEENGMLYGCDAGRPGILYFAGL